MNAGTSSSGSSRASAPASDGPLLVRCASRPDWRISRTHLLRRPHGGRCNPLHSESRMRALHSSLVRRVPALFHFLLLALTTTAASPTLDVSGNGRVAGHVQDQSGTPLAHVQVFVVGTALHA